jgi:hypothetical protein
MLCQTLRCISVHKRLLGIEMSKIDLSYIYETFREMCPIVKHVWTYFIITIYFLWQYYGQKCVFISIIKKIDQIWILLLLLCGNLEKEV